MKNHYRVSVRNFIGIPETNIQVFDNWIVVDADIAIVGNGGEITFFSEASGPIRGLNQRKFVFCIAAGFWAAFSYHKAKT